MADKMVLHHKHTRTYDNDPQNVVGATTHLTLRTVQAHNDTNCKYVRKFGKDYAIGDITNGVIAVPRSDGGGVNKWWFEFYNENDTLLGTVKDENGASAFVDGTAEASTRVYIKLVWKAGTVAITNGDTLNLTTDVDAPLAVKLSGEGITAGSLLWALSESGSTYYMEDTADNAMRYGGYRHTETGVEKYPFFTIQAAETALNLGFEIVTVLDSETYDEELDIDSATTSGNSYIQAVLGQTPTITSGVGARVTREVSTQYNNSSAIYFNENGDDADDGTWQTPKLTPANAITNRGTKNVVYGGSGATISNGIFAGKFTLPTGTCRIEPDYGFTPMFTSGFQNAHFQDATEIRIYGFIFDMNNASGEYALYYERNIIDFYAFDNSFYNSNAGIILAPLEHAGTSIYFNNNYLFNATRCHIFFDDNGTIEIKKNIININDINTTAINVDNSTGIAIEAGNYNVTSLIEIENNIIYNASIGIYIKEYTINSFHANSYIRNNTIFNCFYNIYSGLLTAYTFIKNIIIYGNNNSGSYGFYETTTAYNVDYCNVYNKETKTNNVTLLNEISGDPKFCKITTSYKFGLSADSPCYRTDTSNDDMGSHLRIIELNKSDIIINGFIINGQSQFNNAIYIQDSANHIDNFIKWCTVKDFQGIAIDLYDDDTDTNTQILNTIIKDNGNGIKFSYGGNTVKECLIYGNTIFSIHSDRTGQTFNHNVFYNNKYHLYFESNSGGIIIKNCIFTGATSSTGIYSEVAIILTYCCIVDGYSSNVDITDDSNITDNPNFISVELDNEDFHIKTKEGWDGITYNFDSTCKDAADDGYDIGVYFLIRLVEDDTWHSVQLTFDPDSMNRKNIPKGQKKSEFALGGISIIGKAHKKVFPLIWDNDTYMSEDQYDDLEYISTLIKTLENELIREQTKIRVTLLPDTHIESGSLAVINSTALTLTDTAKTWKINKYKGWWVNILYDFGNNTGTINAAGKTLTVAGAAWTPDEWIGYYFYHPIQYHFYYIKDNDATTLTLSDVNGDLVNAINIDWQIIRSFRIKSNTITVLTLLDPDNELVAGTNNYIIDFMETRIQNSVFSGKQFFGYDFTRKFDMTGCALILEET